MEPKMYIPFVDARISTGFPSPANDYLEKSIDLNVEFIMHPLSTFIFTTEGDSMKDAFIPSKACLLIDRSLIPKTGDIVLAVLDGEFTVKYYERSETHCRLVPANKKYNAVEITQEMEMQVWGVVIKIITDPKDLKYVCPC